MRKGLNWKGVTVLLCLLALQAQSLASVSLSCLHEQSGGGTASPDCPWHQQTASHGNDTPGSTADLDCQRCALGCTVTACLPVPGGVCASLVTLNAPAARAAQLHYYRFNPENALRPPIPFSV